MNDVHMYAMNEKLNRLVDAIEKLVVVVEKTNKSIQDLIIVSNEIKQQNVITEDAE